MKRSSNQNSSDSEFSDSDRLQDSMDMDVDRPPSRPASDFRHKRPRLDNNLGDGNHDGSAQPASSASSSLSPPPPAAATATATANGTADTGSSSLAAFSSHFPATASLPDGLTMAMSVHVHVSLSDDEGQSGSGSDDSDADDSDDDIDHGLPNHFPLHAAAQPMVPAPQPQPHFPLTHQQQPDTPASDEDDDLTNDDNDDDWSSVSSSSSSNSANGSHTSDPHPAAGDHSLISDLEFDDLDISDDLDMVLATNLPAYHQLPEPVQTALVDHLVRRLFVPPPNRPPLASEVQVQTAVFAHIHDDDPRPLLELIAGVFRENGLDFREGGAAALVAFGAMAVREESRLMMEQDPRVVGANPGGGASADYMDVDGEGRRHGQEEDGWTDESSDAGSFIDEAEDGGEVIVDPHDDAAAALIAHDVDMDMIGPDDWNHLQSPTYHTSITSLDTTATTAAASGFLVSQPLAQFALHSAMSHHSCANYLALGALLPTPYRHAHWLQSPITLDGAMIRTHADPRPFDATRRLGARAERTLAAERTAAITLAAKFGYLATGGDLGDLHMFCTQHDDNAARPPWGSTPAADATGASAAQLIGLICCNDMYNSVSLLPGPILLAARNRGRVEALSLPPHTDASVPHIRPHASPVSQSSKVYPVFSIKAFKACVNDAKVSPDLQWMACVGDKADTWLVPLAWGVDDEMGGRVVPKPKVDRPRKLDVLSHPLVPALALSALPADDPIRKKAPAEYVRAAFAGWSGQYASWSADSSMFATSCDSHPYVFVWAVVAAEADDGAAEARLVKVIYSGQPTFAIAFNPNVEFNGLLAFSHRCGYVQVVDVDSIASGDVGEWVGVPSEAVTSEQLMAWTGGLGSEGTKRQVVEVRYRNVSCNITGVMWGFDGRYLYIATQPRVVVYQLNQPRSLFETAARHTLLRPAQGVDALQAAEQFGMRTMEEKEQWMPREYLEFEQSLRH